MYYEKKNGFEIRAFYDPERDELINTVKFRRKVLPTKVLNDKISQSYVGYRLIKSDLESVLEWAKVSVTILEKKSKSESDKRVLHSLFVSMVTMYWKCFADTKGRHRMKLNPKWIDDKHRHIHEHLKNIRHNFAAHSGSDPFESGYLLYFSDFDGRARFNPGIIPIYRKAGHADNELTNNIILLVTSIVDKIDAKLVSLMEKIKESVV
ncbi:hypothetical protein ACWO0M_004683 [Vibrio parahaemolyticus]|uniref:hypothetical protein n=1 Tax=Vibrio parahaemolyticus TaxID=670 RepID=UPI00186A4AA4|nr:hypothetical protein [Vibrio parahaemolyticus]ELY5257296.1 hypothetical protein [Vibrio cholerae]ELB2095473.1 hypothetical protein [Vibrio parahaemolyticus]ELB2127465.1 hypothetical protein [Vibrio parahaemolyticus]MBE4309510.1 hypothetical protein [Vibrio parahaemolyticus]